MKEGREGERKGSESEMTRKMLKLLAGVVWMQLWRVECNVCNTHVERIMHVFRLQGISMWTVCELYECSACGL